ncbi:oligosaccharide flippase family protein [Saccharicrinis fermentans]|uniref:Putative O-antigen transporter n=1 Tax=Saccharicrinis fermentans DSM 9555 = JCM 21142 TaxID=869213 RepID=W7YHI7_9BACT|nr:oligosaccharide flippase family protein [Saccharicrinis fermentans]GAF02029.1 putative O-antigen transporter [Saccharicrinis fermentans DSM 9555 = JCM 21142]
MIFAQTVVIYFSVLINFGFGISATKAIANAKYDKRKINEIVSAVYILKAFLFVASFVIYIILLFTVEVFYNHMFLFFISFFATLFEFLFPQWYFQGVERMRYITILGVCSKVLFTLLIFIFVKNSSDYVLVPLFNVIGFLVIGVWSLYILVRKECITFRRLPLHVLKVYLYDSWPLFLSAASIQLYVNANKLIIGSFLGMRDVAIYDLGEKVLKLLKVPIRMIGQASFPSLARNKSINEINRYLLVAMALIMFCLSLVNIFSKDIILLLAGPNLLDAEIIVRLLTFSTIFIVISQFMGNSRMIIFGFHKQYSLVISISVLYFIVSTFLLFIINKLGLVALTLNSIFVEVIGAFLMVLFCYRKKILFS